MYVLYWIEDMSILQIRYRWPRSDHKKLDPITRNNPNQLNDQNCREKNQFKFQVFNVIITLYKI